MASVTPLNSHSAKTYLRTENKTKIPILEYRFARHACHGVVFEDLPNFLDCDKRIDILWEVYLCFKEATPN